LKWLPQSIYVSYEGENKFGMRRRTMRGFSVGQSPTRVEAFPKQGA